MTNHDEPQWTRKLAINRASQLYHHNQLRSVHSAVNHTQRSAKASTNINHHHQLISKSAINDHKPIWWSPYEAHGEPHELHRNPCVNSASTTVPHGSDAPTHGTRILGTWACPPWWRTSRRAGSTVVARWLQAIRWDDQFASKHKIVFRGRRWVLYVYECGYTGYMGHKCIRFIWFYLVL